MPCNIAIYAIPSRATAPTSCELVNLGIRGFAPGWPLTLATLVVGAVLVSLGAWQTERLVWKEGLIAEIERNLATEPEDITLSGNHEPLEPYHPVRLEGRILAEPVLLRGVVARHGEPGHILMGVVEDVAGRHWLVERGWIPSARASEVLSGGLSVDGSLMLEAVTRLPLRSGPFTPGDDLAASMIFAENLDALANAFGLDLEPMVLVLGTGLPAGPPLDGLPIPSDPSPDLPNNHLGYAITWYGLAGALLAVYIAFGRSRSRGRNS